MPLKRTIALLAIAGIAGVSFWLGTRRSGESLSTNLPAVVREIQQLNELTTVKYRVQKVVGIEEQKAPFGKEKLLLVVQADVLAGIDLSKLAVADLETTSPGAIAISLPPAAIQHVVIDDKETKVWDRQVTWWTPWVPYNPDLERQARLAASDSVRKTALEMDILSQARQNAHISIRRLLLSLGFHTVTFAT